MKNIRTTADLTPDPKNARKRTDRSAAMLAKALQEVGAARSIVISDNGEIIAGNGTVEAAAQVGITKVLVVDADGDTLVAVRRSGLTSEQQQRLALLDNRTADLAEWDLDVLGEVAGELDISDLFTNDELGWLEEGEDSGDDFEDEPEEEKPEPDANRYPLAIVLTWAQLQQWKAFKERSGKTKDREAFMLLLERQ